MATGDVWMLWPMSDGNVRDRGTIAADAPADGSSRSGPMPVPGRVVFDVAEHDDEPAARVAGSPLS
jgi:hypothetical protein